MIVKWLTPTVRAARMNSRSRSDRNSARTSRAIGGQLVIPINAMSFLELRDYTAQLEAAGFEVRKYLVELYSKLSFPLVNLVMVLVAIPFAIQAPRGGRLFGIGLAIAIMAGYLVVHFVALAFARADLLPPLIAAWTANVIFMGVGISLLLRART